MWTPCNLASVQSIELLAPVEQKILATTTALVDDPLAAYARTQRWKTFRGSESDVLDRYFQAARQFGCRSGDAVTRVTGDDILPDLELVVRVIDLYLSQQPLVQHASNNRVPTFPYGSDVEVFLFDALDRARREARLAEEREHVTPYIRNHPKLFPFVELRSETDLSHNRLSIDYPEDLEFNRELFRRLHQEGPPPFRVGDIVSCINKYQIHRLRPSPR